MTPQERIKYLLSNPSELIKKKPFTRGTDEPVPRNASNSQEVEPGELVVASIPKFKRNVISQDRFLAELDPACHDVLFDTNIPSISVKLKSGSFVDIEFKKTAIPIQRMIVKKHVQHLCTHDLQFTLDDSEPSEQQKKDFATFKKYWKRRNIGGMRTKMVYTQETVGEAGLLFYRDRNDRVKARLISYTDGYVICSHNDDNGDRLMECVYYSADGKEYIDAYTDIEQYRFVNDPTGKEDAGWKMEINGVKHGFSEIPLVTKRGLVGWDGVQDLIEVYEIIYNIFMVIQKRHGWGILYIKGKFNEKAQRIAGNVILNDESLNKDGDAKVLTPPKPDGVIDTLKAIEDEIQKGAGATFILPKDISMSGDISGVAVQIAQSLDLEQALSAAVEWQNVADKCCRLFKEGLGVELKKKESDSDAVDRFKKLEILAAFKVWQPRSENEYNTMLGNMKSQGIISRKTATEKNTEAAPDEELRIANEAGLAIAGEAAAAGAQQQTIINEE